MAEQLRECSSVSQIVNLIQFHRKAQFGRTYYRYKDKSKFGVCVEEQALDRSVRLQRYLNQDNDSWKVHISDLSELLPLFKGSSTISIVIPTGKKGQVTSFAIGLESGQILFNDGAIEIRGIKNKRKFTRYLRKLDILFPID